MPQQPVDDWVDVTDDWQDVPVTPPIQSTAQPTNKLPPEPAGWFDWTRGPELPSLWDAISNFMRPIEGMQKVGESIKSYMPGEHPYSKVARGTVDLLLPQSPFDFAVEAIGGPAIPTAVRAGGKVISKGADLLRGVKSAVPDILPPVKPPAIDLPIRQAVEPEALPTPEIVPESVSYRPSQQEFDPSTLQGLEPAPKTPEILPATDDVAVRIANGDKIPDFNNIAENGTVWVENMHGKGFGGYARPEDLNFIYDTARMRGKSLPEPPPNIKSQMNPNVFGVIEKQAGLEFVDPNTGEIVPSSQAKPGMIPVNPETQIAEVPSVIPGVRRTPRMPPPSAKRPSGPKELVGGAPPIKPPKPPKSTAAGELPPELPKPTPQTPEEITQSLSDRLKRATDDPNVSPEEIEGMLDELDEMVRLNPNISKPGLIRQVLGFNKALLTSWDLSAPGRQGKAFILNKSWWNSLNSMRKAWGSKAASDLVQQSIIDHPSGYFKRGVSETGKETKSFAEKVGLDLAKTEEAFNTKIMKRIEKYSGVGKSSRAHTAFLNKLRSDQFVSMMEAAKRLGLDPENNLHLAKSYADFINSATGRGSLDIGKWKLSRNVTALNDVFFAPKNMSGQIRTWNNVLNPHRYYQYDPVLRKQALQSLLAIAGIGLGTSTMAKVAGVDVSLNPTSSDFLKLKFGDTRIDFFGGYQQFPVAATKFITGINTPTTGENAGRPQNMDKKGAWWTRGDVAETFFTNRLSPLGSFVWAWMFNKEFDGKPFEYKRALFERTLPIATKDIAELVQEDPWLAAIISPLSITGLASAQHYTGR